MAGDGKKIAIAVGVVGLLIGGGLVLASMVEAKPPPKEYVCPYCGASFATYEELAAHVETEHPGERIPLPIEWE